RVGTPDRPRRSWSRIAIPVVALLVLSGASVFVGRALRNGTTARVASSTVPTEPKTTPTMRPNVGRSSDPGVRLDFPDEERINRPASRCARPTPRTSLDGLPRGTNVMDFIACVGCDCCLPGGEFPPLWDERSKPIREAGECRICSRRATLESAGLTVLGG